MVKLKEEKTVQLGKVTPSLNKSLVDYAKLIGTTKIDLLEELIIKELEKRVLTKDFIVPEKHFHFNIKELLANGTVKASTNKPSNNFDNYFTVKKIANNLDSKNKEYRTYCYNDNKDLHKGIFVFYFFSKKGTKPVPIVLDYNMELNELTISLIELEDMKFLIENEDDVETTENIIKDVKKYISFCTDFFNGLRKFNENESIDTLEFIPFEFMINKLDTNFEVIEDFKGRKLFELSKLNTDGLNLDEFIEVFDDSDLLNAYENNDFSFETIHNKLIEQEKTIKGYKQYYDGLKKEIDFIKSKQKEWNEIKAKAEK